MVCMHVGELEQHSEIGYLFNGNHAIRVLYSKNMKFSSKQKHPKSQYDAGHCSVTGVINHMSLIIFAISIISESNV